MKTRTITDRTGEVRKQSGFFAGRSLAPELGIRTPTANDQAEIVVALARSESAEAELMEVPGGLLAFKLRSSDAFMNADDEGKALMAGLMLDLERFLDQAELKIAIELYDQVALAMRLRGSGWEETLCATLSDEMKDAVNAIIREVEAEAHAIEQRIKRESEGDRSGNDEEAKGDGTGSMSVLLGNYSKEIAITRQYEKEKLMLQSQMWDKDDDIILAANAALKALYGKKGEFTPEEAPYEQAAQRIFLCISARLVDHMGISGSVSSLVNFWQFAREAGLSDETALRGMLTLAHLYDPSGIEGDISTSSILFEMKKRGMVPKTFEDLIGVLKMMESHP